MVRLLRLLSAGVLTVLPASGLKAPAVEQFGYNELLQRVTGLTSITQHRHMSSGLARKLEAVVGKENILRTTEDMVVFAHGDILSQGRLADVHVDLTDAGFRPHVLLAHHAAYVKGDGPWRPTQKRRGEGRKLSIQNVLRAKRIAEMERQAREKAQKTAKKAEDVIPGVAICMTTIPSHLTTDKGFNVTVESLLSVTKEQDYKRSKITAYLTVAAGGAKRENATAYPVERLANLTKMFEGSLVVVSLEHDVGPASRYVGCGEALRDQPEEYIIGFDDDIAYENNTVSTLVCAKRGDPSSVWTGHSFPGTNNASIGQGADGLIFQVRDLGGAIKDEGSYGSLFGKIGDRCFKVDDLSISDYLYHKGLKVRTLEDKKQDPSCGFPDLPIYKKVCWEVDDAKKGNRTRTRRVCRATIRGANSLRNDRDSGGRGADMYRCADALLEARGQPMVYADRGLYNTTTA